MTQHIDYIASTPSQIASDISSRHPLAIDDLHSIIHHPRSLALSLIHISEPTRPRLSSYSVFCLKKKHETPLDHYLLS